MKRSYPTTKPSIALGNPRFGATKSLFAQTKHQFSASSFVSRKEP
jgi:hypothetical protein